MEGLSITARTAINLSVGRALQARSGSGPRGSPPTYSRRARRRGRTRWTTRSSRPGKPPRASDTRTPARTTFGRWTSSLNHGYVRGRGTHRDPARARRVTRAHRAALTWLLSGSVRPPHASRAAGDAVGLARVALGIQTLGYRSGARNADLFTLLREASRRLEEVGRPAGPVVPGARGPGPYPPGRIGPGCPVPRSTRAAQRATKRTAAANDPSALATAKLAVHDAMWVPGTAAASGCPSSSEMLDAAQASGDDDLVAQARLLRAAALLELGGTRPAGTSCSVTSRWPGTWVTRGGAGAR